MVFVVGITSRDLHIVFRFDKHGQPLSGKKSNTNIMSFMVRKSTGTTNSAATKHKTVDTSCSSPMVMEIPDLQETLIESKSKKKLTSFLFTQQKIQDFLYKKCPSLNNIEVLENEAFIHGLEPSIKVINDFEKAVELDEKNQVRKPLKTSNLQAKVSRVKTLLNKLTEKMQETSKIKIDISKRTYIISVTSTKKNTEFMDVVARANEIKNFIQSESLLSKLKKYITQQKKQDSRPIAEVVTRELNMEYFNSILTWEKAYLDADFIKPSQLPYGLSLLELIRIASHIEQEVFAETMYIETNREKIV